MCSCARLCVCVCVCANEHADRSMQTVAGWQQNRPSGHSLQGVDREGTHGRAGAPGNELVDFMFDKKKEKISSEFYKYYKF